MSIPPVAVPYLGGVVLLGGAGLAKAIRPHDTAVALRRAGLGLASTQAEVAVRLAAAAEVAIAVAAALASGAVPAVLVALSYLGFIAFVLTAMVRHWPLASCGCFGKADTAPSAAHVVVDAVAAAAAIWWAVVVPGPAAGGDAGVIGVLHRRPGQGIAVALGALVCVVVAYGALTGMGRKLPPE